MKDVSNRNENADLLTSQQVADRLSASVHTLWRMVREGKVPQPVRWNRKLVRWKRTAIDECIARM